MSTAYTPVFRRDEDYMLIPYANMIGEDFQKIYAETMEFALMSGLVLGLQYVEMYEVEIKDDEGLIGDMANVPATIGELHVALIHGPTFDEKADEHDIPEGASRYEPPEEETPSAEAD